MLKIVFFSLFASLSLSVVAAEKCVYRPEDVPGCDPNNLKGYMQPVRLHGEFSFILRTLREQRKTNPKIAKLQTIIDDQFVCPKESWDLALVCVAQILNTKGLNEAQVKSESQRQTIKVIQDLEEVFPGQGAVVYETIDSQVKKFMKGLFGNDKERYTNPELAKQDWAQIQDWIRTGQVKVPDAQTLKQIELKIDAMPDSRTPETLASERIRQLEEQK